MMRYSEIPGFSNYFITEDGILHSRNVGSPIKGKITKAGYMSVSMTDDNGKVFHKSLHRIVAEAFCEKPEGATEVNHIDGDKTNNAANNLEWVTHGENLRHAYESGLMPNNAVPRKVVATNMDTGIQLEFPSIYKAARFLGISQGNICMCCKGLRPYANGYYWEYLCEERRNEDA